MLKDVVLCKDCAKRPILSRPGSTSVFDLRESTNGWCPCLCDDPYYSWMPVDNWFCGEGVRKVEETKDECI